MLSYFDSLSTSNEYDDGPVNIIPCNLDLHRNNLNCSTEPGHKSQLVDLLQGLGLVVAGTNMPEFNQGRGNSHFFAHQKKGKQPAGP